MMDKIKLSLIISFLLILFLATSVSATRYINYNFKEGIISSSGIFTATSNPLTNVNAIGFVCTDASCSTVSGTLWSGQVQNSGTSDSMQLTYPTTLQSSYGYGIYYYKPGYITWESNATWWGTTSSDPQGPYTRYLSKKQDCYSPIDSFSVTNDAQANIPLVINVSASLDATTYAAFRNAGPLTYIPPSLLDDYYSVATRIILTIYDSSGNIVNQQTQDIVIPASGSQRIQFTWTPAASGEYTATVATTVPDAKCSSSIEQSSSKEFTVIPEQPRNMCYTILNNLATSDQFPTDGETITITATKISNYADNNYALIPVQANVDLKITKVANGQIVKQESRTIAANQNNYDPLLFSFTWPISSGQGNHNITIKGLASSPLCNGLQNLQDAASEIIYINAKPNEAPTIENLPDVSFNEDSTPAANLIDLWQYASDLETSASQLTYTITSQSNPSLVNCSITIGRYISCGQPALHKYGYSSITVEVSDGQYSDRDTFNANVVSVNDAPTIDFLTASPTLLKGGNTIALTPTNPNDLEQSQLYFYCSELTSEPTATSNICNETAAYSYPYSAMNCAYATDQDDKLHNVSCRVYDGTSYSQALQATYTTDSTPPTINPTTAALTNDNTPTITINGDGTQASCSAAGASVTWGCDTLTCDPAAAIADGNYTVTVSCQDALANTASASVTFTIDTNAPTTTDNAPSTWQNTDVTVTLTPTDAGSGIANTYYCTDQTNSCTPSTSGTSATITAEGTNYLRYYSADNVGNNETTKSATIRIDKTSPTTTDNYALKDNIWQASDQTITLTPTDALSGIASTQYCTDQTSTCTPNTAYTAPVTITSEGTTYFRYRSTDNANNIQSTLNRTIKIDTGAPTTTDNAPSTWQNTDVTVTLTPTDAGSGIANTYYCTDQTNSCTPSISGTSATITAEGTNYLRYYSADNVGNIEATKSSTVMIDKTGPVIAPTTAALTNDNTPTITINGDGTQASCSATGASVTWGCDTLTCDPAAAIADGTYTVDVSCQDIAGNTAIGSVAFTIDTQVPILSNGQPTGTITTNTPVLNFTSNEDASCRGTIDLDEAYADMDFAFTGAATIHTYLTNVLSDAAHTVYARCQDLSGNIMASSYSWSFIVNATPVANADGPYTGFEGSPVAFTALASGGAPPYTFEWDLNNDGSYETPGQNPSVTFGDDYSSIIVLRVTDAENHSTTNQSSVTVNNVAPTANANGPYSCNVSQSITLSGTAADPGTDTFTYDWDLNDDAAFETSAQQNPAYSCAANGTFNVNLRITDDDGGIGYSSATVVVSTPTPNNAPTVTVLSPNGGEVWSGTRNITWNAADPDGDALTITIQYSYDSIPWTNITTTIPNSGIYAWDTTAVPDAATYLIRIIASDGSLTGEDVSNAIFQIDNVFAPDIEILYPNGGETLNGTANIRWIATDGGSNLSIDLYYSQNNITWTAIALAQPNIGVYSWYTPSVLDGNYLIKAVASANNLSDEDISDAYFIIDNIPVAPSPVPAAQKPEDELYVSKIIFENDYALSPNDDLTAAVTIKNTGDTKLEDNTITLTVPDLGLRKRVGPFDLSKGESVTRKLSLNLEGAAPGVYYTRIVISNDKVTRIKHREIVIR